MDTVLMDSNSKMSDLDTLLLNLSDKVNLKWSDRYVTLSNHNIYNTWKNFKRSYINNKFNISAPTCNAKF